MAHQAPFDQNFVKIGLRGYETRKGIN